MLKRKSSQLQSRFQRVYISETTLLFLFLLDFIRGAVMLELQKPNAIVNHICYKN